MTELAFAVAGCTVLCLFLAATDTKLGDFLAFLSGFTAVLLMVFLSAGLARV